MNALIKNLVFISIFLFLSGIGFTDENNFIEIHGLLINGLNKNYALINEKASFLNQSEKLFLLGIHEKNIGIPFAINLLAGFGVGSYVQGDTIGGTIQLSGQILGLAAMITIANMTDIFTVDDIAPGNDPYTRETKNINYAIFTTGLILFCGSRIYGYISPFIYGNIYNNKLKKALQYYSVSYNIFPSIDEKGNGKVIAMLSIKL
jgi:hypothetical protein